MKHARDDYNRIQDPENKIPEDEPVFLLRGQDIHAPDALRMYANSVERNGGDPEVVQRTRDQAVLMCQWQINHKRKSPDIPKAQDD